jgi:hypothetical protein
MKLFYQFLIFLNIYIIYNKMVFKVVNPVMHGSGIHTEYKGSDADNAAMTFWGDMTKNKMLADYLPKFYFTIHDTDTDKLYNYRVSENLKNGGGTKQTEYQISRMDDMTEKNRELFMAEYKKVNDKVENRSSGKTGGSKIGGSRRRKHKKFLRDSSSSSSSSSALNDSSDSDSNSDSDDDFYKYMKQKKSPIKFVWYAPFVFNEDTVFTPVFTAKISPFFSLYIPLKL